MELSKELEKFIGSEQYFKSGLGGLKLTEGINYLRNKVNCYWLIDIVESYQNKLKDIPFQLWRIEVKEDKSAVVTCKEDIGQPNLVEQKIEYTDFPLKEFEFYCIDKVVLLKSEY